MLQGFTKSACQIGTKDFIKRSRTSTGVKDTFQLHFLNQLFDSYKNKRAAHTKEAALNAKVTTMFQAKQPEDMINPLMKVNGMPRL